MKKLGILHLCLITLCLSSCDNGDEPSTSSRTQHNVNANTAPALSVTELTPTDLTQVAHRLEMPRLKGGPDNLFVCHTLSNGTINYCMEYDCSLRASRWTAFQWHKGFSSNENLWNRNRWNQGETFNGYGGEGDPFQPDPLIPQDYRTELEDHSRNGYDRGHMLGSADRLNSREANGQTFYLSNMHPQASAFNQGGIWYNLEDKLRKQFDTNAFRDTLFVVKGGTINNGLYTTKQGASGRSLIVPKHFFMALLCKKDGNYKALAFWMDHKANNDANYTRYAITIDELEEKTGIDFFCNLPDEIEEPVERTLGLFAWGLK